MVFNAIRKLSGAIERKLSTNDPLTSIVKPSAEVRLDGELLAELIQLFRAKLLDHLKELEQGSNKKSKPVDLSTLYDQRDLDRIPQDDEYLRYFLLEYYEVNIDTDQLISLCIPRTLESIQYMTKVGANDFKPEDFPVELFRSNFICGYDQQGVPATLFVSLRWIKKCNPWLQTYINFLICIIDQIKHRLNGRQSYLVFDMSEVSLQEMDFLLQILYAILMYMPGLIRHCYIVDLSVLYRTSLQMLMKVFPEKLRARSSVIDMSTFDALYGDLRPHFMVRSDSPDVVVSEEAKKIEYVADMCPPSMITIEDYAEKHKIEKASLMKFKKLLNSIDNNNS